MSEQIQQRTLRVDPHIIKTVISAQSGSLQKAMMEAVANSMDAGATRVDIDVAPEKVSIRDDGKGLTSADEIFQVFETFGFDHSKLDRTHGRFGVGRGQLFCYGINRWRTHTFEMVLDIDNRGFDYDFRDGLKRSKGMLIDIDLYKPLSMRDSYELEEAFKELVKYSTVPVYYNGKLISKDPAKLKWQGETDDAWYNTRRDGSLKIYSQGLFVMSSYQQGVGGEVVTKPGHALALNMARNDILRDKCTVWPAVQKTLRAEARKLADKGAKQNTLNDLQRRAMAQDALDPENVSDLLNQPLFTLTNNKHLSLTKLLTRVVASAPKGDRRADVLLQRQSLFVLSPETMERFGVETVAELKARLLKAVKHTIAERRSGRISEYGEGSVGTWTLENTLRELKQAVWKEDLTDFEDMVNLDYTEVKPKELNPSEKAALVAVRKMADQMFWAIHWRMRQEQGDAPTHRRTVQVMISESAEAMTDGLQKIWVERKQLALAKRGLPGFVKLLNLLAHEYTHRSSSLGSHLHDQDFFEAFHNTVMDHRVGALAITGLGVYVKHAPKANSTLLKHIDMVLEGDVSQLFQDDAAHVLASETADEPTPQEVAVAAESKPRRRRARQ